MHLFVKTLTGKTFVLDVEFSTDTIAKTKIMLAQKCDVSPDEVFLVLAGRALDQDDIILADHGLGRESTIHCLFKKCKMITSIKGHILFAMTSQMLYDDFNIPIHSQDPNAPNTAFTPYEAQLKFKATENEIVLFIHYKCNFKNHRKFVIINKDEPLYQIGDKLHFYHPTMDDDKSLLQLKYIKVDNDDNKDNNDTILDIYKTPNDYKQLLQPETIIQAEIDVKHHKLWNNNNHLFIGYIRMKSHEFRLYVPSSIIQIIEMYFMIKNNFDTLLYFIGSGDSIKMLDVYQGKQFKLNTKYIESNSTRGNPLQSLYKNKNDGVCTAKGMKYDNKTYDGILYCGQRSVAGTDVYDVYEKVTTLILYEPSQLRNRNYLEDTEEIIIDAFEVKVPDLEDVDPKLSLTFDANQNSFYALNINQIVKLDMNLQDLEWSNILDMDISNRHSPSFLSEDNNLFIIGGDDCYQGGKSQKADLVNLNTKKVMKLPDIPILKCYQGQSVIIPNENKIAIGFDNINILDLNKEKWIEYPQYVQYKARSSFYDYERLWIDINDNNIFYIATNGNCIEWCDIRENKKKFNILWQSTLRELYSCLFNGFFR